MVYCKRHLPCRHFVLKFGFEMDLLFTVFYLFCLLFLEAFVILFCPHLTLLSSCSLVFQTCVSLFLSECAGEIEQLAHKGAISKMCDTLPALDDSNSLVSFRCSPEDANQFVVCPPNTIWAALMRCPENMLFSLKDRKCVDDVVTDCALASDAIGESFALFFS